jgi:dTDP-4-dehydrorhamnose reductase
MADVCAVRKLLDSVRPAAIINCAALVDFGAAVMERLYAVNTLAPATMAEWAARHGAHLVHVSSISVHGARVTRAWREAPIEPDTDYGRSKWLAEECIRASRCPSAIVRFSGLFGRNGAPHVGVNAAIRAAAMGESPVIFGSGAARRNYLHVEDAAGALVHCVRASLEGLFWMGGREVMSIREILAAVSEIYLAGRAPLQREGPEGRDQIVESSPELPQGRTVREALLLERQ